MDKIWIWIFNINIFLSCIICTIPDYCQKNGDNFKKSDILLLVIEIEWVPVIYVFHHLGDSLTGNLIKCNGFLKMIVALLHFFESQKA